MLKIKRTLFDHIREQDFTKYMFINPEQIQKYSGNIFIRFFNHILPPTHKFLRETFNAIDNGKILAQISLVPDKFSNLRYQISSLKIRNGNEFIAKPLLDYMVNKYGGSGVISFLVYIDENNPNIISLFKNECGFRSCAKIEFYQTDNIYNDLTEFDENNFKNLEKKDIMALLDINTENIFPHYRPSLISKIKGFKHKFLKQTKNDIFKVFMVNGKQEGYFRLYDNGEGNFYADIITSKAYEICYSEIIAYIQNYLKTKKNFKNLTVVLKKYRETSHALEEILKNSNYNISGTTHIFVKDYWQKISEHASEDKIFVFFNDLLAQPARMEITASVKNQML